MNLGPMDISLLLGDDPAGTPDTIYQNQHRILQANPADVHRDDPGSAPYIVVVIAFPNTVNLTGVDSQGSDIFPHVPTDPYQFRERGFLLDIENPTFIEYSYKNRGLIYSGKSLLCLREDLSLFVQTAPVTTKKDPGCVSVKVQPKGNSRVGWGQFLSLPPEGLVRSTKIPIFPDDVSNSGTAQYLAMTLAVPTGARFTTDSPGATIISSRPNCVQLAVDFNQPTDIGYVFQEDGTVKQGTITVTWDSLESVTCTLRNT
ncbi:MAG: hypothetical protein LBF65_02460 [Holosporales bacterium]|jgi:hypothetical protein|nr:hypothetical protein [Holosporales bacterium]